MAKKKVQKIPEPYLLPTSLKLIRFSFKHLDAANEKFSCANCSQEYFVKLLETLQKYTWTVEQFSDQNHNERRHVIYFPNTSEPDGFENIPGIDLDQLGYYEGWEIGISIDPYDCGWRVHGILIDEIFFVIWLDPNHALFPAPAPMGV